ncbi:afadin isoform X4 [Aphis craccivora]|uniref:Afadin isoform X4 n=1 Tax=Aphis craccivora TaxID=307492 RepID=A0A6G0YMX1_APHCR|nr:afadin isoform X4 [Aphis craccivora]
MLVYVTMNPEMTMAMKRHEEREALRSVIQQWNANRLDLFELSEPNEGIIKTKISIKLKTQKYPKINLNKCSIQILLIIIHRI